MKNSKSIHNKTYYRMVKTMETVNGMRIFMYGIEGFGGGESVSLVSLSADRKRIKDLVKIMNESELKITCLKNNVYDFLSQCYEEKAI